MDKESISRKANIILKELYGEDAHFRSGQYEAIEAALLNRRSLVVQRTGWGKSLIYFICTKILREQGSGVTLVVSPLLALMDNQLEAAQAIGLKCCVMNSTVTAEERIEILTDIAENRYDLVLITPETLMSKNIRDKIISGQINIGLLVIDEAHCISDWGHDFRLKYMQLKNIIAYLPVSVPLLATTATANDRVVEDLKTQLGGDVFVSRGPLSRESLTIQVLNMPGKAERYAWILDNINSLPGCGIIYCLTQRDCEYLSEFLNNNGIPTLPYYSSDEIDAEGNLRKFVSHEIKAIVSTIKLGMGFDMGDISFVIHYQMPSNIVSYYQQIGRAGRNIDNAYTFLMYGKEDEDILNYFIRTAFPSRDDMTDVYNIINDNQEIISKAEIQSRLNISNKKLEKTLMFLENDGYIIATGTSYIATAKRFFYDAKHYDAVTRMRYGEMDQLKGYLRTDKCYSKYIVNCLDDFSAEDCRKCANCNPAGAFKESVSEKSKKLAEDFIYSRTIPIIPRKKWVVSQYTGNSFITLDGARVCNETGLCMSKYGDPGIGEMVSHDKYHAVSFRDELVEKGEKALLEWLGGNNVRFITSIPSLRSDMVGNYAKRLAQRCGLQYISLLEKTHAPQQKEMENSAHQLANAYESFHVKNDVDIPESVVLIDDIVDSRWTFTVCGYRLMESGCRHVFPFALADSSQKEISE